MEKLVSIIMCTYNENIEWIHSSVGSILNQSYKNIEFIIVNDNPNNTSIKEYLRKINSNNKCVILIENETNIGLTNSLNKGLKYATGEFIARMDADDISNLKRIDIEYKYLIDNDLDFVYSDTSILSKDGDEGKRTSYSILDTESIEKIILYSNIAPHPTWFVKREVFEDLGGYRDVPFAEDYDLILRSIKKSYRIGKISEVLLKYRIHDTGISKSNQFHQYLNSKALVDLYKRDLLFNIEDVKKSLNSIIIIKEKHIEEFNKSLRVFRKGTMEFNNNQYIKGVFNILYSLFISNYFRNYTYNHLKFRLADRFYRKGKVNL